MKTNLLKKIIASFSLLGMIVLLTACPYQSSVPIDNGSVAIPSDLAGKWIGASDKESENPTYFVITIDDKYNASAKKMEYSSSDSTYNSTLYHLTFSNVNGETFMNAKEDGGDTYSLYKFDFNTQTGQIVTSELSDYIKETFSSSEELKAFVAKNKSNSYFFTNGSETYSRK